MTFSVIEWFALILIVVVAIKIFVILINPKSWLNFTKSLFGRPWLAGLVSLILAAIVLYYLMQSGITIVQIFAVLLFYSLLMAVGITPYTKEVFGLADRLYKKNILRTNWFYLLIWIALMIWALTAIF